MVHPLPHLSQNDPRWKDVKLGTSPSVTLGQAGCYITSFAVLANYFNHPVLPSDLNQVFITSGLFANQDLVSGDNDLTSVFPDVTFTTSHLYPNDPPTPADLGLLKQLCEDVNTVVIVEIDLGNNNVHFTPVVDCDGTTVTIMNVWNGLVETVNKTYGDPASKILKYVVYKGVYKDDPLVCDPRSVRDLLVTKASSLDTIGNYLKDGPTIVSRNDYGSHIVTLLDGYIEAANSIQQVVPPAKGSVKVSPESQAKSVWKTDVTTLLQQILAKLPSRGGGN